MTRRVAAVCAAILVSLAQPAPALADADAAPVATDQVARIGHVPPGIEAKVVDGDAALWMSVDPRMTVVVLGLRGEPFLRFTAAGVEENVHAPTVYLDRDLPQAVPAGLTASTPPLWRRVSTGRSYEWHENRLQGPASGTEGWTVPLMVNGVRSHVGGVLDRRAAPTRLWLWPLAVAIVCAIAVVRLGCDVARPVARVLAAAVLPAIVTGRLGRELYGHPGLSAWQTADAAITCALAAVLAYGLIRRRQVQTATLATGVWALYEGAFLLPALTNGYVLAALPATAERLAAAACLALGAAILLTAVVFELPALPRPQIRPPVADGREPDAAG